MNTENWWEDIKGAVIWSRDKKLKGIATGTTRICSLEGCGGIRIAVRWPDKKITYPCSKGMSNTSDGRIWKIL